MTATVSSPIFEQVLGAVDPDSSVHLLRAQCDLIASVEDRARVELDEVCERSDCDWLLLFIGQQVHVDTRGLAVLRDTAAQVRAAGRRLAVVAPPISLQHMVKVLDLSDELPLAETPWDAVALVHRHTEDTTSESQA